MIPATLIWWTKTLNCTAYTWQRNCPHSLQNVCTYVRVHFNRQFYHRVLITVWRQQPRTQDGRSRFNRSQLGPQPELRWIPRLNLYTIANTKEAFSSLTHLSLHNQTRQLSGYGYHGAPPTLFNVVSPRRTRVPWRYPLLCGASHRASRMAKHADQSNLDARALCPYWLAGNSSRRGLEQIATAVIRCLNWSGRKSELLLGDSAEVVVGGWARECFMLWRGLWEGHVVQ